MTVLRATLISFGCIQRESMLSLSFSRFLLAIFFTREKYERNNRFHSQFCYSVKWTEKKNLYCKMTARMNIFQEIKTI